MEIKQSEFIISAASPTQFPITELPEVAFVGRSNVGKSSLINCITNRKKLAKVSSTPGKTKLVNFFLINKFMYMVDLPGYGYAKVSKEEQKTWGKMIESYLKGRDTLRCVVLLVDSRHKPTNDDIMMYNWIKHYNYNVLIVATKLDKLTRSEFEKSGKIIRDALKLSKDEEILYFSSLNKKGKEELIDKILQIASENVIVD